MRISRRTTHVVASLAPSAVLVPALLGGGFGAVHAGAGVLLRYHLTVGQQLSYRTVASVPPLFGVPVSKDAAGKPVLTVRSTLPLLVKYAYPDGSYSIKFDPFGGMIALAGVPSLINKGYYQIERIGPRGQVRALTAYGSTSAQSAGSNPALYLLPFPTAAVDVGSTWTGVQHIALDPFGALTETDSYTLIAFQTVAGRQVAVLTAAGAASVHLRLDPGTLGGGGRMDGTLSSSGTARVFVDTGVMLDQRSVETFQLQFLQSNGDLIPFEARETVSISLHP